MQEQGKYIAIGSTVIIQPPVVCIQGLPDPEMVSLDSATHCRCSFMNLQSNFLNTVQGCELLGAAATKSSGAEEKP